MRDYNYFFALALTKQAEGYPMNSPSDFANELFNKYLNNKGDDLETTKNYPDQMCSYSKENFHDNVSNKNK